MSGVSAVAGYMGQREAAKQENRAKLKNFERENVQYLTDAMLADAKYKNEMSLSDIKQDQLYMGLIDQWAANDAQLDKIFAQGDRKIEKAIVEMYENEYAGTQTGRTAGRLAAKSARKMGFEKSRVLSEMMMEKRQTMVADERAENKAKWDSWDTYETIRYAPIHGHAPPPPMMTPMPSPIGMLLQVAGAGVSGQMSANKASATDARLTALESQR